MDPYGPGFKPDLSKTAFLKTHPRPHNTSMTFGDPTLNEVAQHKLYWDTAKGNIPTEVYDGTGGMPALEYVPPPPELELYLDPIDPMTGEPTPIQSDANSKMMIQSLQRDLSAAQQQLEQQKQMTADAQSLVQQYGYRYGALPDATGASPNQMAMAAGVPTPSQQRRTEGIDRAMSAQYLRGQGMLMPSQQLVQQSLAGQQMVDPRTGRPPQVIDLDQPTRPAPQVPNMPPERVIDLDKVK